MPNQHQGRSQTQKPARKKLIRRADRDHSQPLRFIQILFATLNVWIRVRFYLWVRWAERSGVIGKENLERNPAETPPLQRN